MRRQNPGGLGDRLSRLLRGENRIDPDELLTRLEAERQFLEAVDGYLPDEQLTAAYTLRNRAGNRLALSRDHTVVALAGATGGGKSSLFNGLAGFDLSPVGVRRPTTGATYACVWGELNQAIPLLDWVGVLPQHRFVRESVLDAEDESALHGLILLDLPDFDSVQHSHRMEVERLLGLVDLVVWVVDPQKYADRVVHQRYLRDFRRYREVTLVVLNQVDRLAPAEVPRLLGDLRRLLDSDGLSGVPVLTTTATDPAGLKQLRDALKQAVTQRQAALRRLWADIDGVAEDLATLMGHGTATNEFDQKSVDQLIEALAASAGVDAVVEATESAYRHRAVGMTGWPLVRGLRRLRPDPLRRLHLPNPVQGDTPGESPVAATSVPDPTAAQRSAVGLATRATVEYAGADLSATWRKPLLTAARSRLSDLPDALDQAVASTDLGLRRKPLWWRLAGTLQWLVTLTALAGLGWLVLGYALRALGLPPLDNPMIGMVPLPTVLLFGGLLAGILVALAARPVIGWAARRARKRAEKRLDAAVRQVAEEYVLEPARDVLRAYGRAQAALEAMRPPR